MDKKAYHRKTEKETNRESNKNPGQDRARTVEKKGRKAKSKFSLTAPEKHPKPKEKKGGGKRGK